MKHIELQQTAYSQQPVIKSGFTFIEILVVITIIGILAAVAMVSYRSANIRSRDAKRKADIEQIRSALEMYRADNNIYPTQANLSSALTPAYMQTLPPPPKTTDCTTGSYVNCYSRPTTTTYSITITLEVGGSHTVNNP